MNSTETRQHVHALIDQLPPAQLAAVEGLLESMVNPVAHALRDAPVDDEVVTDTEGEAIRRSEEWFRHNKGIPMEEVMAEFGLSIKDFPVKKNGG
jgi:hypothetical protein